MLLNSHCTINLDIQCRYLYRKTAGNSAYKAGGYQSAIVAYSKAIEADNSNAALYTNRAAASLMLLRYKEALIDCDSALVRDSANSKAFFRKATALKGLGLIAEAIAALTEGLKYDPKSGTAIKDKEVLELAVLKISELKLLVAAKQYTICLPPIERLQSSIGSNFRALNILKAECLMHLKRTEEAYNLTNTMVSCRFIFHFLVILINASHSRKFYVVIMNTFIFRICFR